MTPTPTGSERSTPRQLAYLKALATRAGQTFAYPRTRADASREIERLKHTEPSGRVERAVEHKQIADAIADGPDDAARVRPSEITGYGSSATWKERS
jgi:hypothetical protein